jgi:hypothetical protein
MPKKIELVEGLPRFQEDDVAFVVQKLPPHSPCSVQKFMRAIGVEPKPRGNTSHAYQRMLAAFREGERQGRLSRNGIKWRVAA